MAVTMLDGRTFSRFVAAGTYFLRKYRGVVNDLNVFPVPDGDTGSNLYLTMKAALLEAFRLRDQPLSIVASAAANGSLLGARGNSGVIFSQMLRGFAHTVRHRETIDTFELAVAMRDAVATARAAVIKPVEGTMLSVLSAAADEAYRQAMRENDFVRVATAIVRAANDAVDRTPEQLPVLKEAGVVDSGGAGLAYFLEGILHFLPESRVRATSFPRRPARGAGTAFTSGQHVGEHKFCTEFVLDDATIEMHPLRDLLATKGDSLIVAGAPPTLRVHIHTDDPDLVQSIARRHGTIGRLKVDNMEQQHDLLVVDRPPRAYSLLAVVPGPGYDRIARELGAEETLLTGTANPSVRELLLAINKCLEPTVLLFPNDANIAFAASEAAKLAKKTVLVVPTRDIAGGLAALLATGGPDADEVPDPGLLAAAAAATRSADVFFAGKTTVLGGVPIAKGAPTAAIGADLVSGASLVTTVEEACVRLGAESGGLLTVYYGGGQKERDAERLMERLRTRFPAAEVEYYFGGARSVEFTISFER